MKEWILKHAMLIESIISSIVLGLLLFFGYGLTYFFEYDSGLNSIVKELLADNRGTVYGSVTSTFGVLFGFTLTTTSLCLNLTDKKRFEPLRKEEAYRDLWKYFLKTIVVLGAGTLVTLTTLIVDRTTAPVPFLTYLVAFFVLLSTLFLANCVYALKRIVDVATRESMETEGGRENTSPNQYEEEPVSTIR